MVAAAKLRFRLNVALDAPRHDRSTFFIFAPLIYTGHMTIINQPQQETQSETHAAFKAVKILARLRCIYGRTKTRDMAEISEKLNSGFSTSRSQSEAEAYLDDDERCLISKETCRNNGGMQAISEVGLNWLCDCE